MISFNVRRLLIVVVLATLVCLPAIAQDDAGWWGSYYMPGNIAASAEAGLYLGAGLGIDLTAAGEYIFTKVRPGNLFSLDLGAGVRGLASFYRSAGGAYGYTAFGAAPFLGVHMGFRGFDFDFAEYVEPLDVFAAVGLGYVGYTLRGAWTGTQPGGGLTFMSFNGFNYFLTDRLALSVVYSYWANFNYINLNTVSIGARLKIGPKEELGDRPDFPDVEEVERGASVLGGNLAYMQFVSQYWLILGFGGFIADDESFEVGDGVRWWMALPDENDVNEIEYTRALLHVNDDGSRWWRSEFEAGSDLSDFEYLVDDEGRILSLRYEDPSSGEVVTYEPEDPDAWWGEYEESVRDREELEEMSEGTERIRVPAGTYRANRVTAVDEPYEYTWWYTEEVPGLLVKLEGYEDDTLLVEGELREVLSGITSPWGPAW